MASGFEEAAAAEEKLEGESDEFLDSFLSSSNDLQQQQQQRTPRNELQLDVNDLDCGMSALLPFSCGQMHAGPPQVKHTAEAATAENLLVSRNSPQFEQVNSTKRGVSFNSSAIREFIHKIWIMVENQEYHPFIHWNETGDSIFISTNQIHSQAVLPIFFKHKKLSSFIRQLNLYGFVKNPDVISTSSSDCLYFIHPCFQRNQPELLPKIKRRNQQQIVPKSGNNNGVAVECQTLTNIGLTKGQKLENEEREEADKLVKRNLKTNLQPLSHKISSERSGCTNCISNQIALKELTNKNNEILQSLNFLVNQNQLVLSKLDHAEKTLETHSSIFNNVIISLSNYFDSGNNSHHLQQHQQTQQNTVKNASHLTSMMNSSISPVAAANYNHQLELVKHDSNNETKTVNNCLSNDANLVTTLMMADNSKNAIENNFLGNDTPIRCSSNNTSQNFQQFSASDFSPVSTQSNKSITDNAAADTTNARNSLSLMNSLGGTEDNILDGFGNFEHKDNMNFTINEDCLDEYLNKISKQ